MFAAYFGMMNYARIEIQVTTSLFFRIIPHYPWDIQCLCFGTFMNYLSDHRHYALKDY